MSEMENVVTRLNDIESSLRDVQNWRDPRNTNARIETIANNLEGIAKAVGVLTQKMAELEKGVSYPVSPETVDSAPHAPTEKKGRGRPRRKCK
jgi:hypothetical protein